MPQRASRVQRTENTKKEQTGALIRMRVATLRKQQAQSMVLGFPRIPDAGKRRRRRRLDIIYKSHI